MHGTQAEEHASAVRIQVRGTLAHQVGSIQQLVGTNGGQGSFLVHQVVRINTHGGCRFFFGCAESIPEPFQGKSCCLGHAHHVPCAGHGTAEGVHAPLGVDGQVIRVGEHDAAGANGGEGLSVFYHAGTHGGCRIVTSTAYYQRAFRKAGQFGSFGGNVPGHLAGLVHLCQQALVNVQRFQQLIRPAAMGNVQHLHAAGIGHFRGEVSR